MESTPRSDDDKKTEKKPPARPVINAGRFVVGADRPPEPKPNDGPAFPRFELPKFTLPTPERSEPEAVRSIRPPEIPEEVIVQLHEVDDYDDEADDEEEADNKPRPRAAPPPAPVAEQLPPIADRQAAEMFDVPEFSPSESPAEPPVEYRESPAGPSPEYVAPPPAEFEPPEPPQPPPGGNQPPKPPVPPEVLQGRAPEPEPEPEQSASHGAEPGRSFGSPARYNAPPAAEEYITRREFDPSKDARRGHVALFATSVLVGWWVNHLSKNRDKALGKQIESQQQTIEESRDNQVRSQEEITRLNRNLNERSPGQFDRQETHPAPLPSIQPRQEAARARPGVPVVEQLFGNPPEEGPELPPDEHVEHSAWHSYRVNREGHVVNDPAEYGKAFHQEQARERQPSPFGADDQRFASGAPVSFQPSIGTLPQDPLLPSGQVPSDHSLSSGPAGQHPQHLLPPPDPHPLLTTLGSPWLWLGVGVLLIIFFFAATV